MTADATREPRVEYALDSDAYRAAAGMSHSDSKLLRKSPYHYHELAAHPQEAKTPTPQMVMGTLAHCAALEPGAFDERYVVGPDVNKNSNAWKDFVATCTAKGAQPIAQAQRDCAFAMAASALRVPDFQAMLAGFASEVSMWWRCPETGILCKARPDLIKRYPPGIAVLDVEPSLERQCYEHGFAILGDLKTTEDASQEAFARSVADYSYHTQASWYCEGVAQALGVPVLSMLFVVVERDFPHAAASYTLDDNAMTVARDINLAARKLYFECSVANSWPGYPVETRDIALPPWYMKRYLLGEAR